MRSYYFSDIMKTRFLKLLLICTIFLTGCNYPTSQSHQTMIEAFIEDLIKSDSVKCLNSISLKNDNKIREAYLYRKDISKAITYLQTHEKPTFHEFKQYSSVIAGNLEDYTYSYQMKDSMNTYYALKFEFTNFAPDKIYNFTFNQIFASDTKIDDTIPKLNKEDLNGLIEISRNTKK